jgi:uncharacterized caspase-like protein
MRGLIFALAMMLAAPMAWAEQRMALVIGNSSYDSLPDLPNPSSDANLLKGKLEGVGFAVTLVRNGTKSTTEDAIVTFANAIRVASGKEAVTALIFYAGHGVSYDKEAYLVPVDAKIASRDDIPLRAVNADALYKQLDAAGARTVLVFLDACREVISGLPSSTRGGSTRGLSEPSVVMNGAGFYVAYSTAPGMLAADGDGVNSPFATALAKNMARPGVSVLDMMSDVRRDVMTATSGTQRPWDSSSLTAPFYMVPGKAPSAADEQTRLLALQKADYERIKASARVEDFDGYLRSWPDGPYADLARELRQRLIDKNKPAPISVTPAPVGGAASIFNFQREELGVRVDSVLSGTPFAPYLFRGDVIRQVDGKSTVQIENLEGHLMTTLNEKGQVMLLVQRGRTVQMVTVKLR